MMPISPAHSRAETPQPSPFHSANRTDEDVNLILTVDRTLADLESILSIVNQAILSFSPTIPLAFTHPPGEGSTPYLFPSEIPMEPNTGSLQLNPCFQANSSVLAHERSMYYFLGLLDSYKALDVPAVANVHSRIRTLILGEISRICDTKGREWDAQRSGLSNVNVGATQMMYRGLPRVHVICGASIASMCLTS